MTDGPSLGASAHADRAGWLRPEPAAQSQPEALIPCAIELPFPPATLSPNARLHWRSVHRAKTLYKDHCQGFLLVQQDKRAKVGAGRIPILIVISPPDRRKRDRDNLQASLKCALDCLAKWLGVDDYLFDPAYLFVDPVKGGRVTVSIG